MDGEPHKVDSSVEGTARQVFLSYALADAATAQTICEFLEGHGVSCWIAPRDVKPGAQYADAIVAAINEASAVVVVLSGSAVASTHVGKEVERASSKRKSIIAFRIDPAALNRSLEYFLSESQWIDAPALGMPTALAKLAEAVGQSGTAPMRMGDDDFPGRRKRRRIAVVAAAGLAVGVAAISGMYFLAHKTPRPARTAAAADKSIAVLPFVDMSEKKDQEYFADGMAEEILDLLTKIPGLTVIGRTSSFEFKGKNEDLRSIGQKLDAAYVLEGSVRKSGDQVRITAQLINTGTGAHEWSETYDRPIGDAFKLQDAIAAGVVRELQLTIAPGTDTRIASTNPEAYDLYLRGRHAVDRTDRPGADDAITLFQQAIDRDPTFADAYAALGYAHFLQVEEITATPAVGCDQARRAAQKAVELDPKNVRGRVVIAQVDYVCDWDWRGAERVLNEASAISPRDVDVLMGQAALANAVGRWNDSLTAIKASLAQDPLNAESLTISASPYDSLHRLDEAEAALRRALEIRPNITYGHYNLGMLLLERGDAPGALREIRQEADDDGRREGLAIVNYALGKKTESDAALADMLREDANGSPLGLAEVYAFRGQLEDAIRWLERAYSQKDPYFYLIKGNALLKPLEGDPRYKAIIKKMNLPES